MHPVSTLRASALTRWHAVLRATAQDRTARLRRAIARWRERRFDEAVCSTLRSLDDRTLHDLGIDRSEIRPALLHDDPTRMPRGRAGA